MNAPQDTPLISLHPDPFIIFNQWFMEARSRELELPEAMSLATSTVDGKPSLRMVLLKDAGPDGFVFYSNAESRKGREIAANPAAAICLHWKSLGRQVRAEGQLTIVDAATADAYFRSRPRPSQIGAWASDQSRPIADRGQLTARFGEFERRFAGSDVPRPPHWLGYRLAPSIIEFWQDVADRMHDRLVYSRRDGGWITERLAP